MKAGSEGAGRRLAMAAFLCAVLSAGACSRDCPLQGDAGQVLDCGNGGRTDTGGDWKDGNVSGAPDGVDLPRVDVEGETQGGCGDGVCAGKPGEDCAACPQDCPCGEAQKCGTAGVCCKPAMCGTLGHECGATVDECGLTLQCGMCEGGEGCVAGVCSPEVSQANLHFPQVVAGVSAEIVGVGRFGGETVALSRSHLVVAGPGEGGASNGSLRSRSLAGPSPWRWTAAGPTSSAPGLTRQADTCRRPGSTGTHCRRTRLRRSSVVPSSLLSVVTAWSGHLRSWLPVGDGSLRSHRDEGRSWRT